MSTPRRLVFLMFISIVKTEAPVSWETATKLLPPVGGTPVARGLEDLLDGGMDYPRPPEILHSTAQSTANLATTVAASAALLHHPTTNLVLAEHTTSLTTTSQTSSTGAVASLLSQQTDTPNPTSSPSPTSSTTYFQTASGSKPASIDWHVVGIAAIIVGVAASIILGAVFFDQCVKCADDIFCGGRRGRRRRREAGSSGMEELVPDWKRGSWEYKPRLPEFTHPPPTAVAAYMAAEEVVGSPPPAAARRVQTVTSPGILPAPKNSSTRSPTIQMSDWLYKPDVPAPARLWRRDAQPSNGSAGGIYPGTRDERAMISPFADPDVGAPPITYEPLAPADKHAASTNLFQHRDDLVTSPTSRTIYLPEDAYGGMV